MQTFQSSAKTALQRKPTTTQQSEQSGYNPFLGNKTASQNPFLSKSPIQKEEKSAEKKDTATTDDKQADWNFEEWLTGNVYDLMKKELGEDKLKAYSGQIAEKVNAVLNEQLKNVSTPDNTLTPDQIKEITTALNAAVKDGVAELLLSPEGKKLKETLLAKTKSDPGVALGMALLGLAAFYLSNSEIPKIDKNFKLGDKSSLGVKAELGKIQTPKVKNLGAVFKYAGERFRTEASVTYKGGEDKKEQDLSAKGKLSWGKNDTKDKKYTRLDTDLAFNTNLANRFGLGINPYLHTPDFGLGVGLGYDYTGGKKEGEAAANAYTGSLLFNSDRFRLSSKNIFTDHGDKDKMSGESSLTFGKEDKEKEKFARFILASKYGTNMGNDYNFAINPKLIHPSFNLGAGFAMDSKAGKEGQDNTYTGNVDLGIGETFKLNSKLIYLPNGSLSLDLSQLIQFSKFLSLQNGFQWNEDPSKWGISGGLTFENKAGVNFASTFGFNSDDTLTLGITGGYKKDGFNIGGSANYQNQTPKKDKPNEFDPSKFTAGMNLGYERTFNQRHQFNLGLTGKGEALGGSFDTVSLGLTAQYTLLRRKNSAGKDEFVPLIRFSANGDYDLKPFENNGVGQIGLPTEEGKIMSTFTWFFQGL
ncbi:MAG: hypothetical protein MUE85_20150 [Microscillaceae bacterium]|jgi:hypothetical protein|nr:hypothetical protein [Microscillaceae bacterium]